MSHCPGEQRSQHWLGRFGGFGPVNNQEEVLFAVFETTIRKNDRLTDASFTKSLVKLDQSIARCAYTTRQAFANKVVRRGEQSGKGSFEGVSLAGVERIRELRADIRLNAETRKVRSLCVLDKVGFGELTAHATMGYSSALEIGLSKEQLGKVRKRIRLDLADVFSEISSTTTRAWPGGWSVFFRRIGYVARALRLKQRRTAQAGS